MVSQKVYELCRSNDTVTSVLAQDPSLSPGDAQKNLYGKHLGRYDENKDFKEPNPTAEDLKRTYECGKWGPSKPSELFLKIYHDVICTLEHDPLIGMVSPPLMGSCGVVPLTIISPLPDICRHMANCIARAQKEVMLATNYWKCSDASTLISNSIRELSKRAGERGSKVIVKIMYDRGNPKQVFDNHQPVLEAEWTVKGIALPALGEIPNVDMQVLNYHRPIFGTFHSKYMIVDRRIAILSSNNIQDNDNLEMMTHLEGPIVDSFYDMALNSWYNKLEPQLPMFNSPAAKGGLPSFEQELHSGMFNENGVLRDLVSHSNSKPQPTPETAGDATPLADQHHVGFEGDDSTTRTQEQNSASQTASGNSVALPEHTAHDPHYDPDIASEVLRAQSVLSPRNGETRMQAVTRHMNTTLQPDTKGNAPECEEGDEMTTYIPLPAHDLVPMAMVCRKPWGSANLKCIHVPQNEAFLSGLRNATKSVFIQTPNLNAEPLLSAILEAVKRKVDVYYYVCLGYNDSGELLPFQNGVNEMFANRLYSNLEPTEKEHLHIYNYVGKDQMQPIHNKFKKRSCHVKIMIVDEHIGIQGNGNQDTQTWFHSQEINVMVDSHQVCVAWAEAIRRNQNTHIYGAVSKEDGCWHDKDGNQAEGAIGTDPGKLSWAKGIIGAVQRVRGGA